jgi:hypothetical protein
LPFKQDGVTYNLYDMPKGFVIKGNLDLSYKDLTALPDLSNVVVAGSFYCFKNQLTSLKGAPKKVGGDFFCCSNQLTSLEGAPQKVDGDFTCFSNLLDSLEGAPQKVGGDFICSNNQLISLENGPQKVGGDFICFANLLNTLKGSPVKIGGNLECHNNCLITLVGMPEMQDDAEVRCDADMARKYGLSVDEKAEESRFTVKELYDSPAYQNGVKIEELKWRTKHQEDIDKRTKSIEKTKAAFDAWLKQNGKDSPEK